MLAPAENQTLREQVEDDVPTTAANERSSSVHEGPAPNEGLRAVEIQNTTHLERAKFAHQVSLQCLNDATAFQMHLWRRFRDVMKVYFGCLGVLGLACQQTFSSWSVWSISSVLAAFLVAVASLLAALCAFYLMEVFDGSTYSMPHADDIKAVFLAQAKHFDKDRWASPESYDIFPPLSNNDYLKGGRVTEAGFAMAADRLASLNFSSAAQNEASNLERTNQLKLIRSLLGAQCFFSSIAWIVGIF